MRPAASGARSPCTCSARPNARRRRPRDPHLLHGLAQSGIRITAISPGYVETEFAARYHDSEEAARTTYGGLTCLEAQDVARAVDFALSQPAHVQLHDILIRPTAQVS